MLLVLPISFTSFAVDSSINFKGDVIELPFPSPSSFGESSRSFVYYNELKKRFDMFVLVFSCSSSVSPSSVQFSVSLSNPPEGYNSPAYYGGFTFRIHFNEDDTFNNVGNPGFVQFNLYRYWWYTSQSKYSLQRVKTSATSLASNSSTVVFNHSDSAGSYFPSASFGFYNGTLLSHSGNISTNISYNYSFSGDGSISQILSSLVDVNTNLSNIQNQNDTVNSNLSQLISQGNAIIFYEQEILNVLKNGSDYTPEQTTTNKDMSDYENAEGALMDNNISALNNMQLPDLNSFNSGNQGNAFQFISSNIEFFSGMNGSGSIAKVASVLLVVLGLGLTSFIIGLSNRRKGQ